MTRVATAICPALLLVPFAAARPPADQQVRQVLAQWTVLRTQVSAVRYSVSGVAEWVGDLPQPDPTGRRVSPTGPRQIPVRATILIDLANGRTRIEEVAPGASESGSQWVPEYRVHTYDRTDYRTIRPPEQNPAVSGGRHLGIHKGNIEYTQVSSNLWPVYIAHGIVPTSAALMRYDRLPVSHDPDDLRAVATVVHDGRTCLSIKTEPVATSHEIWVDTARRGAVLRLIRWTSGGRPSVRLDMTYRDEPTGPALTSWACSEYRGGKLNWSTKYHVTAVERNPVVSDAAFTIPIEPGMKVTEAVFPARDGIVNPSVPNTRTYEVGQEGGTTPVGESSEGQTLGGDRHTVSGHTYWWWVGGACSVLVFSVMAYRRVSAAGRGLPLVNRRA